MGGGKDDGRVVTRCPPEPNGYLHIGHAKSICLNFGVAESYGGACHLRFDDTNPEKEEDEYIHSIKKDVEWLGFEWTGPVRFASDYFDPLHDHAVALIRKGLAYVDTQSPEQIAEMRGNFTTPGRDSPHRERSVEENLALFADIRDNKFDEGAAVLRAKIDLASKDLKLRDPLMYRIRKVTHHRTGDTWCIYPMYDWTHGQSDSIEGITHSICTLEFENHRPLYEWYIDQLGIHKPQQIEFARLNLTYAVMSKRKLLQLVKENHVSGRDDPPTLTIRGLRRRGYTPESIRRLCEDVGVSKTNSMIDLGRLENAVRDHLNRVAHRKMAVLRPLKVVIENYPEDLVEEMEVVNNPEDQSAGTRKVPFCREIYIEREDFM